MASHNYASFTPSIDNSKPHGSTLLINHHGDDSGSIQSTSNDQSDDSALMQITFGSFLVCDLALEGGKYFMYNSQERYIP
jgi:hypothetical protein